MGMTTFSGPVRSLAGFITGPDAFVPVASGNVTLTPDNVGKTTVINFAGPSTITLPKANADALGTQYSVLLNSATPATGIKIVTPGATTGVSDVFTGSVYSAASGGAATLFLPNGTTDDVINLAGATGGVSGTSLTFTCTTIGKWSVSGNIITTGAPTTPFAAT